MASDQEPKSSFELAMERLRKQDADAGVEHRTLSRDEKDEIAEIRRVYDAKLAQEEIMHSSALMRSVDLAERMKLDEQYQRERTRLSDEREAKIEKIRRGLKK